MGNRNRPQFDQSASCISPNPAAHADVLVEWYGVHTALAMARFYSTDCPAGAYWSDVLATLTARFPQTNQTGNDAVGG